MDYSKILKHGSFKLENKDPEYIAFRLIEEYYFRIIKIEINNKTDVGLVFIGLIISFSSDLTKDICKKYKKGNYALSDKQLNAIIAHLQRWRYFYEAHI